MYKIRDLQRKCRYDFKGSAAEWKSPSHHQTKPTSLCALGATALDQLWSDGSNAPVIIKDLKAHFAGGKTLPSIPLAEQNIFPSFCWASLLKKPAS